MSNRSAIILKTGRGIRGFSQHEVAEIYGVDRRTYQRWESGKSNVPSNHFLAILDDVFHLSIEQITEVANASM
ncbi:MAG: helix-turn-helix transcriptional regulator [Shewanella oncorhynchi]|uniref:helix-turn-helix transcriptional regulator n=1 Tax=Shewanella sp. SM87 TaxID=2912808 RepID=UPI0021DA5C1B|nr:helix-turn-helix transcriptional regulator [Shewanella sp. SM87]MCU8007191.1 helix-turn-helix domain-containing protein [Shewanella sp. SM87]